MVDREAYYQFKDRARAVFPDRYVKVHYTAGTADFIGSNIAWISLHRSGGGRDIFHADKNCPHFPEGYLKAMPVPDARAKWYADPCDYCTTEE